MSIFDTDFHSHILPGIDDGSSCLEESLALLKLQAEQGAKTVIATPHFRYHSMSVDEFLKNRDKAYQSVINSSAFNNKPNILLGAEIALERNLYEIEDITKLAVFEMNTLLIELPYEKYRRWMSEEIEEISYKTRMQIVIAHLDRYIDIFSDSDYERILSIPDAIFQLNISAFKKWQSKKLVKKLMKQEYPLVFGTDCHNLDSRRPNFDILAKALKGYTPHFKVRQLFDSM